MNDSQKPNIVALLTGRGGSSLPNKNILSVAGKPLLYYPAEAGLESTWISGYYVSSDDEKILLTAEKLGYNPIKRPEELGLDTAQHIDSIRHGLDVIRGQTGMDPDIVVVLLANTVVIKTEWIDACIQMLLDDDSVTCAAPVYEESNHHPIRAKKINKEGFLETFFDFADMSLSTNRQDLDPSYFFCHNFWVLRPKNIDNPRGQAPWTFMGDRIKPYVIDDSYLDVHTMEDVKRSEEWLMSHTKGQV